jgi:release factor glutamine methyltransferase
MEWAARNRDELDAPVTLVLGDLFEGLPPDLMGELDVVVSNPPYVAEADVHRLGEDVRDHEPHEALFAGLEGLLLVEVIASEARRWLRDGGWLVMEIGYDQATKVADLLPRLDYSDVEVSQDLAGRDRIVEARWTG